MDTENTGIITGEKARSTFEKSGLPPTVLGEIWQISDPKNLGFLTQFGFCNAMRLIGYTQAGQHPTAALADYPGPLPKFADLGNTNQLQPQSTNSSFMHTQPSSVIPQNTATLQFQPQDPISTINIQDYQKFSQLFIKTVGSPDGELGGAQARNIFMKAKLPTATLGQIWNLVDRFNVGKLDVSSFIIAMHLIQGLLSGQIKQLPPFLPENIWQSVEQQKNFQNSSTSSQLNQPDLNRQVSSSSTSSQQTTVIYPSSGTNTVRSTAGGDWVATPAMVQQFESIFNSLDKSKSGKLEPDQVASFLITSKLNQQDLATIWDLADIQNTGIFTKLEFSIALFLVNQKLAGEKLPNIIPDSLISSLKSAQQSASSLPNSKHGSSQQQPKQSTEKPKSSIDDLADIFGKSQPASSKNVDFEKPTLETRVSGSDLSHYSDLPKSRNTLSGSFRPTSTFGQQLMQKKSTDVNSSPENNLLGDDLSRQNQPASSPVPSTSSIPSQSSKDQNEPKLINYDALRSVPPPPSKRVTADTPPATQHSSNDRVPTFSSYQNQDRSVSGLERIQENTSYSQTNFQPVNNDLLADSTSEISGQLSQGSTDIANVSNQIKSLASQTTILHDKKSRAEQELQRVLNTKKEIEGKLTQLRASYDNEVKQVEQVESNLKYAKEEAEALRSEASISEAKLNALSTQLHEKQLAMEEMQKENSSMTEKLGTMNAEIVDLQKQVEAIELDNDNLSKQLNIKKSQVQVTIVKHQDLRNKIAELEQQNKAILDEILGSEAEHNRLISEHQNLLEEQPKLEERYRVAQEHLSKLEKSKKEIEKQIAEQKSKLSTLEDKSVSIEKSNELKSKDISESAQAVPDHSRGVLTGTAIGVGAAGVAAALGSAAFRSFSGNNEDNATEESESRLPELETKFLDDDSRVTNVTGPSSFVTNTIENETPVTSPNNSEFQFPQSNSIPGGIAGMTNDLMNVQRTDSLTSSVQNNAALSVRDDNIDVSDREADKETILLPGKPNFDDITDRRLAEKEDSDGDKFSSGVESFEIVNAEEATQENSNKELDGDKNFDQDFSDSSAINEKFPPLDDPELEQGTKQVSTIDQEFPPIKELEYDESSSEADSNDDAFDDANDNFGHRSVPSIPNSKEKTKDKDDTFDNAFDDLEPAKPESDPENDLFVDEFDDLEIAKVDDAEENFPGDDISFSNEFTNGQNLHFSIPTTEFDKTDQTNEGIDEWERLFAGFGNAQEAASPVSDSVTPQVGSSTSAPHMNSTKDQAIHELVGMGFDENTAIEALEKQSWDLAQATNYLLDNA